MLMMQTSVTKAATPPTRIPTPKLINMDAPYNMTPVYPIWYPITTKSVTNPVPKLERINVRSLYL